MKRPSDGPMRGLARAAGCLAAIGLIAALMAGCAATSQVAPTDRSPRLLDPTGAAQASVATAAPNATTAPAGAAAPTAGTAPGGTPAPAATPAPTGTLTLIGAVERVEGAVWVVDGLGVRVPTSAAVAPGLGAGSLVRVLARVDDDDDQTLVAVSIGPVREAPLVGQVIAIDGATLVIDDRRVRVPAGLVLPQGLAPGTIARVVVDDDDGALVLRLVEPLPAARALGGTVELLGDDIVVIGGQRLRLGPGAGLWRVRPAPGRPVRVIVAPVNNVLTVVSITVVNIVVPPALVVAPVPPPVVNVRPPAPRPPARPPASFNDDDDDDDDDDD